MDSLQSLDNRLREEHDNIKEYAAQISQQDEGGYVEEERPRQQRGKKKPDPSPRRAMPRYYERTQSREEFDNDENDMYMDGEDNYTFRRSPSLRSLRQQPTYMSGTEGSMSRSHYASADNLSRRPMRRKPEVRDGDWKFGILSAPTLLFHLYLGYVQSNTNWSTVLTQSFNPFSLNFNN